MEQNKSNLTFFEATSIIIGHGVGSGILAVPFLASRVNWIQVFLIVGLAYAVNLLMHLIIAELSLNNGGKQFIKCFEMELFKGRLKKVFSTFAFGLLGLSVLLNVSGFIAGSAAVLSSWLGIGPTLAMVVYYILTALVVFFGFKAVGVCEKIAVGAMMAVIVVLFVSVLQKPISPLPTLTTKASNLLALYGMVSFSLSAVMSVPQVVKALDKKQQENKTEHCARNCHQYGHAASSHPDDPARGRFCH